MWDNLTCWQAASVGEVVVVNCPELFHDFMGPEDGQWNEVTHCVSGEFQNLFHAVQHSPIQFKAFCTFQRWGELVVTVQRTAGLTFSLIMQMSASSMTTPPNLYVYGNVLYVSHTHTLHLLTILTICIQH